MISVSGRGNFPFDFISCSLHYRGPQVAPDLRAEDSASRKGSNYQASYRLAQFRLTKGEACIYFNSLVVLRQGLK